MSKLKKIAVLENMVEARMLESLLVERSIPHMIKTYHDTAYDGLFQGQLGWGHIEAPADQEEEILAILHDLRAPGETT